MKFVIVKENLSGVNKFNGVKKDGDFNAKQ